VTSCRFPSITLVCDTNFVASRPLSFFHTPPRSFFLQQIPSKSTSSKVGKQSPWQGKDSLGLFARPPVLTSKQHSTPPRERSFPHHLHRFDRLPRFALLRCKFPSHRFLHSLYLEISGRAIGPCGALASAVLLHHHSRSRHNRSRHCHRILGSAPIDSTRWIRYAKGPNWAATRWAQRCCDCDDGVQLVDEETRGGSCAYSYQYDAERFIGYAGDVLRGFVRWASCLWIWDGGWQVEQ